MLKNIVMATTLTAGIISAMADSPDFTWFIASKIVAVILFTVFAILSGWEGLTEAEQEVKKGENIF